MVADAGCLRHLRVGERSCSLDMKTDRNRRDGFVPKCCHSGSSAGMMVKACRDLSPGRSWERADEEPDLPGDVSMRALCATCDGATSIRHDCVRTDNACGG